MWAVLKTPDSWYYRNYTNHYIGDYYTPLGEYLTTNQRKGTTQGFEQCSYVYIVYISLRIIHIDPYIVHTWGNNALYYNTSSFLAVPLQ